MGRSKESVEFREQSSHDVTCEGESRSEGADFFRDNFFRTKSPIFMP